MNISETAQFIHDWALSLPYEAAHFPAAAGAALAWLKRATVWATHHGQEHLAAHLLSRIAQVQAARR